MANALITDLATGQGNWFETSDPAGVSKKVKRSMGPAVFPTGGYRISEHAIDGLTGIAVGTQVNNLILYPFRAFRARTVPKLAVSCTTFTAAFNARVGIYNSDPDTTAPTTLLVDAGVLAISAQGMKDSAAITAALIQGEHYWFAAVVDTNGGSLNSYGTAEAPPIFGTDSAGIKQTRMSRTFNFGALPTDETGQAYTFGTNTFNPVVYAG